MLITETQRDMPLLHKIYIDGPYGNGGSNDYSDESTASNSDNHLDSIEVWNGKYVDGFQCTYVNSQGHKIQTGQRGCGHDPLPGSETFIIAEDDYITRVDLTYGNWMNTLQFTTNNNSQSPVYGGHGPQDPGELAKHTIVVPDLYECCGFVGKYGVYLNSLGVIYRQRVTQQLVMQLLTTQNPGLNSLRQLLIGK